MAKELDPKAPNVFTWEYVLGKRLVDNDVQYLIKWKGYSHYDNTWESASTLPQEVADYYENVIAPLKARQWNSEQPSLSAGANSDPGSSQSRSTGRPVARQNDTSGAEAEKEYYIGSVVSMGDLPILGPRAGNPYSRILNYIPETKIVEEVHHVANPRQIKETQLAYFVFMKDIVSGEKCAAYIHHQILKIAYPELIIQCYQKNTVFTEQSKTQEELNAAAQKALSNSVKSTFKMKSNKKPVRERIPLLEDTSSDSSDSYSDDSDTYYEKIDIKEYLSKRLKKDEDLETDSD